MRLFATIAFGLCLLASCSGLDDSSDNAANPLSQCVITESVQPGKDAFIQWNGFTSEAELFITGADGKEVSLQISVITASGLIFKAPSSIAPGVYSVFLRQGDVVELGKIEILESDLPISGLDVPGFASPGETALIRGIGFDAGHSIVLKSDSQQIRLEAEATSSGLQVAISQDVTPGRYGLYLSDGKEEWLLMESFVIAIKKRLLSVTRTEPYEGSVIYQTRYEVEYAADEVKAVVYSVSHVENGAVIEVERKDRYAKGDDGTFRVDGGSSSSNNFNFSYVRDSEGRIISSEVLRYSRNNPEGTMREFQWVYDAQGRPSRVTYVLDGVTRSLQVYIFENDNLVETNASSFAYEESSLGNPFAPDAGHVFDMMANTMEPFLYVPLLSGEGMFVSRELPSGFKRITGATSTQTVPFTYMIDADGYPQEMSWDGGQKSIVFEYDNI